MEDGIIREERGGKRGEEEEKMEDRRTGKP
jgi:hypothetical protein